MTQEEIESHVIEGFNQYSKKISQKIINEIVKLRKEFNTLNQIFLQTQIYVTMIREILKRELGEDYTKYCLYNNISDDLAKIIIGLKNKGKSIKEIAYETKISYKYIENLFDDPFTPVLNNIIKKLDEKLEVKVKKKHYSEILALYQSIWDQVRLSYKQAEKLVPVVLYMFYKIKWIKICSNKIIEASNLPEKKFRNYLLEAVRYCPEYLSRNRTKMVQELVLYVIDHFHFDHEFVQVSDSLLRKFWNRLTNTTDSNIAGVICILTMIKLGVNSVSYSTVCKKLGIRMGNLFYQVKHNILSSETVEKFTGFKRSPNLLKPLLIDYLYFPFPTFYSFQFHLLKRNIPIINHKNKNIFIYSII